MIELHGVSKLYRSGKRAVTSVQDVPLSFARGDFTVIMGPSGSGKSTLLHLLGLLDQPTSGSVLFEGTDVRDLRDRERSLVRRRRIGFVFQSFNLLPTMTAEEIAALPLLLDGERERTARELARASLERIGLLERADHFPDELSGGEAQRVAIARALAAGPDWILCDEPTGNLDSTSGREVLALLRELPEAGRRSVVLVTHDMSAAASGDRLIRLQDGRVVSDESARGERALAFSDI
jgi:putative ABC transport system ATP-binding protein